jgi:ribosomal protein S18 acetylase RimI-like enzyme
METSGPIARSERSPRPLHPDDAAALLALSEGMDRRWWGQVETELADVTEMLAELGDLDRRSLALLDGDRVVGAVTVRADGSAEPLFDVELADAEALAVLAHLLDAARERGAVEFTRPADDNPLATAHERAGLVPAWSAFALERKPTAPRPVPWPEGIRLEPFDAETHAASVHEAVYSVWTQVPGHHERDIDSWRTLFLGSERAPADLQVVAWDGAHVAGVAICRTYAPATGWVSQLAVTDTWRGRGLGRALLVEACRRLAGVEGLDDIGLSVIAGNARALGLYRSVGFEVTREWVITRPEPRGPSARGDLSRRPDGAASTG